MKLVGMLHLGNPALDSHHLPCMTAGLMPTRNEQMPALRISLLDSRVTPCLMRGCRDPESGGRMTSGPGAGSSASSRQPDGQPQRRSILRRDVPKQSSRCRLHLCLGDPLACGVSTDRHCECSLSTHLDSAPSSLVEHVPTPNAPREASWTPASSVRDTSQQPAPHPGLKRGTTRHVKERQTPSFVS